MQWYEYVYKCICADLYLPIVLPRYDRRRGLCTVFLLYDLLLNSFSYIKSRVYLPGLTSQHKLISFAPVLSGQSNDRRTPQTAAGRRRTLFPAIF